MDEETQAILMLVENLKLSVPQIFPWFYMSGDIEHICSSTNLDIRVKELIDIISLFKEVILRLKEHSLSFVSACLPQLLFGLARVMAVTPDPSQLNLLQGLKFLRHTFVKFIQTLTDRSGSMEVSHGLIFSQPQTSQDLIFSLISCIEACLSSNDAAGFRAVLAWFVKQILVAPQTTSESASLFLAELHSLLMSRLGPICVLAPARLSFTRSDEVLYEGILKEVATCLHHLVEAKVNPSFK
ncbi:unnamed protein product [Protopolystoma xenopodis]|uniref:Uncharacterized protein n=1 Tax=Protopolystoma xenopodis TaxID=117903 RepID=A0A448XJX0_9PLAT|nr:unnamed protein product [Protopolystoma xenopodis]